MKKMKGTGNNSNPARKTTNDRDNHHARRDGRACYLIFGANALYAVLMLMPFALLVIAPGVILSAITRHAEENRRHQNRQGRRKNGQ